MVIHARLREERERLGFLQKDVAKLVGMTPRAQLMYEAGTRQPDSAYLASIADVGFDVLYILTGERAATGAAVPLPAGVQAQNGQALLGLHHWATLLNLRAEHGRGRDLMWCEALIQALSGYKPRDPTPLAVQRYSAAAKYDRKRHGIAMYLLANWPAAPWLVWPGGTNLQDLYPLDLGQDCLPLYVPDAMTLPAPALLLSESELRDLEMGQTLLVDWHGSALGVRESDQADGYADTTERAIKRCFFGK